MSSINNTSNLLALLPNALYQEICQTDPFSRVPFLQTQEKKMLATGILLANLLQQTTRAFLEKKPLCFNANPGDHGCQMRAFALSHLFQDAALQEEASRLHALALTMKTEFQACSGGQKFCKSENAPTFFNRHFEHLTISKEMLFLLRSYLLTITKVPDLSISDPGGFVFTRIEVNQLRQLSKNIEKLNNNHRQGILNQAAVSLARDSIDSIKELAAQFTEAPYLAEMFKEENLRCVEFEEGYPSKTFSCLFSQIQTILKQLQKEEGIVVIKQIVKGKETPACLALKGSVEGFRLLSEEELSLNRELPVVVFEGVFSLTKEELLTKIEQVGFEEMILTCSAQEPPFDRKSSKLKDVKHPEVQELIQIYRKKAAALGLKKDAEPFFATRHVFCNLLEEECP